MFTITFRLQLGNSQHSDLSLEQVIYQFRALQRGGALSIAVRDANGLALSLDELLTMQQRITGPIGRGP